MTDLIIPSRRRFLGGLLGVVGAAVAAPAIVKITSIMPVKAIEPIETVLAGWSPAYGLREYDMIPEEYLALKPVFMGGWMMHAGRPDALGREVPAVNAAYEMFSILG